jgi:hypothetical protein
MICIDTALPVNQRQSRHIFDLGFYSTSFPEMNAVDIVMMIAPPFSGNSAGQSGSIILPFHLVAPKKGINQASGGQYTVRQ